MKAIALVLASASIVLGIGLLGWVAYDATRVLEALGLQDRLDEATVALVVLAFGGLLAVVGAVAVHRIRALAMVRTA